MEERKTLGKWRGENLLAAVGSYTIMVGAAVTGITRVVSGSC